MDGWLLDGCISECISSWIKITKPVWETKAASYNAGVVVMQIQIHNKQIQMIQWLENCPW